MHFVHLMVYIDFHVYSLLDVLCVIKGWWWWWWWWWWRHRERQITLV